MSQFELVNTETRLAEVVSRMSRVPRVAVDVESNGFFRYHERVCLVQLAADETAFLVDPLAIGDVRPLGQLLSDQAVEKVLHAAGNDVRSLDRDWGFRVNNLFDTSIAAAFVGSTQLGLQSVLQEHMGLELAKLRKLQLSDWTIRPLSPEALKYAADDVLHLPGLRDVLAGQLKRLSRQEWAKEEFTRLENVRHTPSDRELAFLAIKGSRDLDGRGLAVLRSLFQFRERAARRLDRPPFKVIPDSVLVQLSSDSSSNLTTVKGLGRFGRPPASRGLKAAIEEGLRARLVTRPKRTWNENILSPTERREVEIRLRGLKTWRSQMGQELRLDPGLLWPAVSLERLARSPDSLDAELVSPEVRRWQKREFGGALRGVLATLSCADSNSASLNHRL